jgi:hypothetical protein
MKQEVYLRLKNNVGRMHRGLTTEWSEHALHASTIAALVAGGEVEVRYTDPRVSASRVVKLIDRGPESGVVAPARDARRSP